MDLRPSDITDIAAEVAAAVVLAANPGTRRDSLEAASQNLAGLTEAQVEALLSTFELAKLGITSTMNAMTFRTLINPNTIERRNAAPYPFKAVEKWKTVRTVWDDVEKALARLRNT